MTGCSVEHPVCRALLRWLLPARERPLLFLEWSVADVSLPALRREGAEMFYWAAVFLVIALIAGVLGFGGIAGISSNIAWILFVVGLIVAVVLFLRGRAP
jgi:uncharacterized membrane protein YtjA (UPF0391 family)